MTKINLSDLQEANAIGYITDSNDKISFIKTKSGSYHRTDLSDSGLMAFGGMNYSLSFLKSVCLENEKEIYVFDNARELYSWLLGEQK